MSFYCLTWFCSILFLYSEPFDLFVNISNHVLLVIYDTVSFHYHCPCGAVCFGIVPSYGLWNFLWESILLSQSSGRSCIKARPPAGVSSVVPTIERYLIKRFDFQVYIWIDLAREYFTCARLNLFPARSIFRIPSRFAFLVIWWLAAWEVWC